MRSTQDIFESELRARNVPFSGPDDRGLHTLRLETRDYVISLENIDRDYQRDRNPEDIKHFVDQILTPFVLPSWENAISCLFFSAEPSDYEFSDVIRWRISDAVCKVLVLMDSGEARLTWVTPDMLGKWGVSLDEAAAIAATNMDDLLEGKEPELQEIDGMHLGMIPVSSVCLKAATIFAPGFKHFATKKLDWPILAVIPCRDFAYILSEKDMALLNRMGAVVQREYRQSGYPIATEVIRISDEGFEAIGAFPE